MFSSFRKFCVSRVIYSALEFWWCQASQFFIIPHFIYFVRISLDLFVSISFKSKLSGQSVHPVEK